MKNITESIAAYCESLSHRVSDIAGVAAYARVQMATGAARDIAALKQQRDEFVRAYDERIVMVERMSASIDDMLRQVEAAAKSFAEAARKGDIPPWRDDADLIDAQQLIREYGAVQSALPEDESAAAIASKFAPVASAT